MSRSRATTGPSTLKERIAALQRRGSSPQPTSLQRLPSPANAGGSGLRDKIARFEQKGGTPIPRGSFGLGAPPQQASKRSNELWGNRLSSASIGTASLGRSASLSVSSSGRARCVSDAELGSLQRLQGQQDATSAPEPALREDAVSKSDTINSLDIATHTPTSPSSKSGSQATFLEQTSRSEDEPSTTCEPLRTGPITDGPKASTPPASPLPPAIIIHEEEVVLPDSSLISSVSIEVQSETVQAINQPKDDSRLISKDVPDEDVDIPDVPTLKRPSSPSITIDSRDDSQSPGHDDGNVERPPHPLPEQSIPDEVKVSTHSEDPIVLSDFIAVAVFQPPAGFQPPMADEEVPRWSLGPEDDLSAQDTFSLNTRSQHDTPPPTAESTPTPQPVDTIPAIDQHEPLDLSRASHMLLASQDESLPPHEPSLPTLTPKDSSCLPPTELVFTDVWQMPDLTTRFCRKGAPDTNPKHMILPEQSSESAASITMSSDVALDSLVASTSDIPDLRDSGVFASAPESPDSLSSDAPLPVASSSVSEASYDSPHVTPILDAFPSVPRYLPPTSLPARARSVSGYTRAAIDRSSSSSFSSTKSTPSLSCSTTSSSTSSPTSATIHAPRALPDSRHCTSSLQRSKSQTTRARPISSVPAWYDDDSDDGEAGWANVIVTTRRY